MVSILPVIFPYTRSNIPLSPGYGVYISQLIRYARACSTYDQFLRRGRSWCYRDFCSFVSCQGFASSLAVTMIWFTITSLNHMLYDIFDTNRYTVLGTLTSTVDNSAFIIMELGSWRVWPVDKGCLLLLGTWSHLQYFRGSMVAHLFLSSYLCFETNYSLVP
jgi:hypothetical protein